MMLNNITSLNELFNFIDKAKISGTLSFPFRVSPYDPDAPLAYRLWYTVELTNKLINDWSEDEFQLAAIKKAEQTLVLINLDVLNSAKNISSALDCYLSAIRDVDTKVEYLKSLRDQEILFSNPEDVQRTPPEIISNLEFMHYSKLVEFLTSKVLMWLQKRLEDDITLLKHTSKYSEFSEVLYKKANIKFSNSLTHRQEAIIFKYKSEANYISRSFKRTEVVKEFGKSREKAYDSVNENSSTYREIKIEELEAIVPQLSEYPNAQKAAMNDLDRLKLNL